ELRTHTVRPLLLKGPAITSLLYPADSTRSYQDADLLVAPPEYETAERCLARLGFQKTLDDSDVPGSEVAGHPWQRGGDVVDLHWTLAEVGVGPEQVWEALQDGRRILRVNAVEVDIPGVAARALIVALHAAPPGAVTMEVLSSTRGAKSRLRLAARKIVPTRRFMRNWFPRSRDSNFWLAVGYLWRPLWLSLAAGPAFLAWRRVRHAKGRAG